NSVVLCAPLCPPWLSSCLASARMHPLTRLLVNRCPTSREVTPITQHQRAIVDVHSRQRRKRRLQHQLSDGCLNLDQTLPRPLWLHCAWTQNRIKKHTRPPDSSSATNNPDHC